MIKPGSKDRKAYIVITGLELDELQRFIWMMAESFGSGSPYCQLPGRAAHRALALGP